MLIQFHQIHQGVELFIELRCKDLQGVMAAIFAPLSEAPPFFWTENPPALLNLLIYLICLRNEWKIEWG